MTTDFEQLSVFRLQGGAHDSAEDGLCAMEGVAWLEGLEHTDHPECTCPVIAAFVRTLNDHMPEDERQRLIPYLPRLVGTVSPEHEQERAEYLAWHTITVITPNALEKIGLREHAEKMKALPFHDWDAAYAAADAAYAAADAAADAAPRAAVAAYAAARAARAADGDPWLPALNMLDGALAIGPQSPGFSKDTEERVAAYRELVGAA